VPVIVAVEDGNRLSNVDVEELEDGKSPDAVKETIDKDRKTKDGGTTDDEFITWILCGVFQGNLPAQN
jgi:hypothetical protein